MQTALLDTVVLYGALVRGDQHHDAALPILQGMDDGDLPVGTVLDFVYAETFNALNRRLSHEDCVEAAELVEGSAGFQVERTNREVWTRGNQTYRRQPHLSFVDALEVAYARENEVDYVYSFDTGFDSVEGVHRINTAENPYSG